MAKGFEIFSLFGSILVDSDKANESISKTEKNAESMASKLGKGIKTAGKWGLAIGAGALVAGGALLALATKTGDAADRLLDLNSITGMTTDEIQRWERVTKIAGVSVDSMTNASQKLTKAFDLMATGTGKGAESLEKLGLSFEEISAMNADQRMDAITQALAGVEDKTERARIGTDLLGGSWKEIAPIVDLGAEAMQKAKDSANIVSNDDLKKANDFRISMELMKDRVNFLVMELGVKLIPVLQDFFDWVAQYMPKIEEGMNKAITFGQIAFEKLGKAIDFVKESMDIILPVIGAVTAAMTTQLIIETIRKAYAAFTLVTKGTTIAQAALNLVMSANPFGVAAIAVGLLAAAAIALYRNWDKVVESISKAINWIKKFNRTDVKSKQVSVGRNSPRYDGSHANGLEYVPYDGYIGELHKGEEVLTADDPRNQNNRSNNQEITINTPVYLDGKKITTVTSRVQLQSNKSKARAWGVTV